MAQRFDKDLVTKAVRAINSQLRKIDYLPPDAIVGVLVGHAVMVAATAYGCDEVEASAVTDDAIDMILERIKRNAG